MIQVVVGSAGNVNCVLDEAIIDDQGRVHTGYFADRHHWICSAVQQSAGASLQWWSGLTGVDPATLISEMDTRSNSTALFAPYLCGERTPHLDPDVRGAFLNLNQHTSRGDLTRAILEGVAFSFKDAFEIFQALGISPNRGCRFWWWRRERCLAPDHRRGAGCAADCRGRRHYRQGRSHAGRLCRRPF